jgi:hypothetical protein
MLTDRDLNRLASAAAVEIHEGAGKNFQASIGLDLRRALDLIANLQVAARHPGNHGPAAHTAREIIDELTAKIASAGCTATLALIELGENQQYGQGEPQHDGRTIH